MDIHQMQVKYDAHADRVLWQLRSRAGELVSVWLTRRMATKLWPPFQRLVTQVGILKVAGNATVLPEAQEMLAQAARQRPLPSADFRAPFDGRPVTQPLGPEPLLPEAIDLTPLPDARQLLIRIREPAGRQFEMRLGDELATALMRLLERALVAADWFAVVQPPAAAVPGGAAAAPSAPILN
jgi:hypothetical protein